MSDPVNHPPHYYALNGMEAIDVIEAFFFENAYLANVFKYIARAGKKDSVLQDLSKAKFYLQREIDRVTEVQQAEAHEVINDTIKRLAEEPGHPRYYEEKQLAWFSLDDVPLDTTVEDIDGDQWYLSGSGYRYVKHYGEDTWNNNVDQRIDLHTWDAFAPFVAVDDDE